MTSINLFEKAKSSANVGVNKRINERARRNKTIIDDWNSKKAAEKKAEEFKAAHNGLTKSQVKRIKKQAEKLKAKLEADAALANKLKLEKEIFEYNKLDLGIKDKILVECYSSEIFALSGTVDELISFLLKMKKIDIVNVEFEEDVACFSRYETNWEYKERKRIEEEYNEFLRVEEIERAREDAEIERKELESSKARLLKEIELLEKKLEKNLVIIENKLKIC